MARTQHIKLQWQDEADLTPLHASFQQDSFAQQDGFAPQDADETADGQTDWDAPARRRLFQDDSPAAPDAESEPWSGTAPEDSLYPDMVYQPRRRAERHPESFQHTPPPYDADAVYDPPERNRGIWMGIAFSCLALIVLILYGVSRWHRAYAPFRQKVAIVSQDTIAQGVLVDGIHVGGMTRAQAEQALKTDFTQTAGELHMTLRVDDKTWILTPAELPFVRNTQSVLDTAYAIGRQGSVETIASGTTPFEYRYQHLYHTVASHVDLHTVVTYDPATVRSLVGIIEANINRDAVDAQVATFDFNTRSFTFTQDQAGAKIDGDALYNKIVDALNRRDFSATITMSSQVITPSVTKAELMNSFSLVSSYSTETTSNANRNTNIDLAARAVSGTVVMPGETFSFNKATGQRTIEKGYLPAAAIQGGATVDEIGGGVCQVSSTLFNAAAMADLTILSRTPHAWPSNYVDKGRDATVNWPNLDFTFRNDKSTPIFIVAWYEKRTCTVELYGASLGTGRSISLATKLVYAMEPPEEAIYELNPALEPGTMQEKKKARTGYLVETYKVYKRNGRETSRELLCTSTYQMIQQVIEYNE